MAADRFLRILVRVAPEHVDQFVVLCWELGTAGLMESEEKPHYFEVYFPSDTRDEERVETLCRRALGHGLHVMLLEKSVVISRPEDWLAGFREHFKGFPVGGKFWIHPPWENPSAEREVNIEIEPGAAFGTGTHESTQLCLIAVEEMTSVPRSILDVGTGSGILTVATVRLWPEAIAVAIDNDPRAAAVARATLRANQVPSPLLAAADAGALRGRFDLVLANLTRPILETEAPVLASLCARDLVVSGFTEPEEKIVQSTFEGCGSWLKTSSRRLGGWSCLSLRRRQA